VSREKKTPESKEIRQTLETDNPATSKHTAVETNAYAPYNLKESDQAGEHVFVD
jgi:hypothetical protein